MVADTVAVSGFSNPLLSVATLLTQFQGRETVELFTRRSAVPGNFKLPIEVLERVFSYLNPLSLGKACQVCRRWSEVPWGELDIGSVSNKVTESSGCICGGNRPAFFFLP